MQLLLIFCSLAVFSVYSNPILKFRPKVGLEKYVPKFSIAITGKNEVHEEIDRIKYASNLDEKNIRPNESKNKGKNFEKASLKETDRENEDEKYSHDEELSLESKSDKKTEDNKDRKHGAKIDIKGNEEYLHNDLEKKNEDVTNTDTGDREKDSENENKDVTDTNTGDQDKNSENENEDVTETQLENQERNSENENEDVTETQLEIQEKDSENENEDVTDTDSGDQENDSENENEDVTDTDSGDQENDSENENEDVTDTDSGDQEKDSENENEDVTDTDSGDQEKDSENENEDVTDTDSGDQEKDSENENEDVTDTDSGDQEKDEWYNKKKGKKGMNKTNCIKAILWNKKKGKIGAHIDDCVKDIFQKKKKKKETRRNAAYCDKGKKQKKRKGKQLKPEYQIPKWYNKKFGKKRLYKPKQLCPLKSKRKQPCVKKPRRVTKLWADISPDIGRCETIKRPESNMMDYEQDRPYNKKIWKCDSPIRKPFVPQFETVMPNDECDNHPNELFRLLIKIHKHFTNFHSQTSSKW